MGWLRTTGLPEAIPDTGDAVDDLGTGFGAGMTRAEAIAGMGEQTMLKRLLTLAELGKAAAFLASDRASAMTATLANVTCGAFLDEPAAPGRPALNDRAPPLNAPRSTTRGHRPGGTSRESCSSAKGETMSLPDNPMPSSVPAVDQTLVLPDGRTLGYALWGQPEGSPVLLVGTSPGSRLLCPDLPATVAAGVRLVTVDRPGAGRSDPDPQPGMARWVADTGALVDHLRLGRVGLVGWSGGGQFALAAAAGLPDRVTSVALVGTPAPAHDDQGDWPPEEIRQLVDLVRKDPQGAVAGIAAANQWYPADPQSPMRLWSAPGDQAVGNLSQVAEAMAVMLREGARQGVAGLVYDLVAGSLDWGFALGEVRTSVALWYGTVDPVVSPQHGRYYAQRLPNASQVHTRAADHLLAIPLWADILGSLGLPQGR